MKPNYKEAKPKVPEQIGNSSESQFEIYERLYSLVDTFDKSLSYNQGFKDCVYMLKIALRQLYKNSPARKIKNLQVKVSELTMIIQRQKKTIEHLKNIKTPKT